MLSFALGRSSISVFIDGVFNSIDDSHANYPYLLEELKKPAGERDLEAVRQYITIQKMLETMSFGRVSINEEEVMFDGQPVVSYMTQRMLEILQTGVGIEPWARFMDNVFDNPAAYARSELYEWMEKGNLPITPEGHFLAFKKVRADYTDCHTGRFDNSPGNILEMDRGICDPNRDNHCSSGFHFASAGYLRSFGGQRVIVVEINPRDVTSIPSDYKFTKGRCCRYRVVAELKNESAAYHGAWASNPVIDFENPAEFPMAMLTKVQLPDPAPNAPAGTVVTVPEVMEPEEIADENLHDEIADMIHEEEEAAALAALEAADTAAAIGAAGGVEIVREETPAGTVMTVVGVPVSRLTDAEIESIAKQSSDPRTAKQMVASLWAQRHEAQMAEKAQGVTGNWQDLTEDQKCQITAASQRDEAEARQGMVFTTTDDRTFSASVILAALEDASIRGAAKNLGIGESTLRGWKKKLGA